MIRLEHPVRDETCKDRGGTYYLKYYFRRNPANPDAVVAHAVPLSIPVQDSHDIMNLAATALQERQGLSRAYRGEDRLRPAAASVLRLCLSHDRPTVEVVRNTIVSPYTKKFTIAGDELGPRTFESSGGAEMNIGQIRHKNAPHPSLALSDFTHIAYLPHENYDRTRFDHQGVTAHGGGDTDSVTFGLLGGEEVIAEYEQPRSAWA